MRAPPPSSPRTSPLFPFSTLVRVCLLSLCFRHAERKGDLGGRPPVSSSQGSHRGARPNPDCRTGGGLSGFTRRAESDYDPFGAAHSSTSISAALGFATA